MREKGKMQKISIEEIAELTAKTPTAILGAPQHGKTTLAKHICHALCQHNNMKIRIWDSSTKWLFDSPIRYYYTLKDRHEDLSPLLKYPSICFDTSELRNIELERSMQRRLIFFDAIECILRTKRNKGEITSRTVQIIEESQGVFTSNSLRKSENLPLAKWISTSANWGLSWLIITRRASEVSTQIFEHTNQKCIAQTNQPNCLRKLRQILDWETIETIKKLGIGEFIVLTPKGVFQLKTKKFQGDNPKRIERVTKTRRKGFLKLGIEAYEEFEERNFDEEEDEWDEFLTTEEEWET